jgi:hypothetical protein
MFDHDRTPLPPRLRRTAHNRSRPTISGRA